MLALLTAFGSDPFPIVGDLGFPALAFSRHCGDRAFLSRFGPFRGRALPGFFRPGGLPAFPGLFILNGVLPGNGDYDLRVLRRTAAGRCYLAAFFCPRPDAEQADTQAQRQNTGERFLHLFCHYFHLLSDM